MVSELNKFIAKSVDELSRKFQSKKNLLETVSVLLLMRRMYPAEASHNISNSIRDNWSMAYDRLERENPMFEESVLRRILLEEKNPELVEIADSLEYIHRVCREEATSYFPNEVDAEIFDLLYAKTRDANAGHSMRIPRQIIKLMVALSEPDGNDSLLDATFNSGYFLVEACKRIQYNLLPDPKSAEKDDDGFPTVPKMGDRSCLFDRPSSARLQGIEENEEDFRLGVLNLAIRELSSIEYVRKDFSDYWLQLEAAFDVVLANPPFGTRKSPYPVPFVGSRFETQYTDLQFLDRILKILSPGGRACIVVPESSLTKTTGDYVRFRQLLLDEYALEAVISLPAGTFSPYTNAKASILVVSRKGPAKQVWFYELENVGYSLDRNRRRTKGQPLQDCLKWFIDRKAARPGEDQKQGFFVEVNTIRSNNGVLAVKRYRNPEYEPVEPVDPQKLFAELFHEQQEIDKDLNALKELIR